MFRSYPQIGLGAQKPEWSVEVSDYSISVTHQGTKCLFRFSRTENIPFVSNNPTIFLAEGMPNPSDDLFGEAMQIAIDTAAEEWR